eukprot:Em0877g2a
MREGGVDLAMCISLQNPPYWRQEKQEQPGVHRTYLLQLSKQLGGYCALFRDHLGTEYSIPDRHSKNNYSCSKRDTALDSIALALALMRARLSLPYKLAVALERDQPIRTARRFAIRHKHRLASVPQHPYVSWDACPSKFLAFRIVYLDACGFQLPVWLMLPSHSLLTKQLSLAEM